MPGDRRAQNDEKDLGDWALQQRGVPEACLEKGPATTAGQGGPDKVNDGQVALDLADVVNEGGPAGIPSEEKGYSGHFETAEAGRPVRTGGGGAEEVTPPVVFGQGGRPGSAYYDATGKAHIRMSWHVDDGTDAILESLAKKRKERARAKEELKKEGEEAFKDCG